jgi:hypothetical protein
MVMGCLGGAVCAGQEEWEELKGDHFIVYYVADPAFAREVLRKAEYYYDRVARDLGYTRYGNFWKWERRCKILVFPDQEAYIRATGQPSWSIGSAHYDTKEVISYSGCQAFLDETLPHEIAHLIFRDFVGFESDIPGWLDEGVAQRQEASKQEVVDYYVWQLARARKLWPLEYLTRADPGMIQDPDEARTFYIQAASVVSFLIDKHGASSFIHLCRQLRDGKTLDEALQFTYPTKMRDLNELEEAWLAYVAGLRFPEQRTRRTPTRVRMLVTLPE